MLSLMLAVGAAVAAVYVSLPAHPRARVAVVLGQVEPVSATEYLRRRLELFRRYFQGARGRAQARLNAIEALQALAGELRSGQPMRKAIPPALGGQAPHTCAAATWGGDVAQALQRDAHDRDIPLWRSVAACWQVSESSGAGLAAALDRLVVTARATEELRVQLEAHLAAPRATARMLSLLPAMGIVLGMTLGGDPLGWLLGNPIGRVCLVAGVALTLLGLWWVRRIASKVERNL
ncbi:MAG: type II secretion system F family protein [Candidatus Nanopelagicales bacterium]